MKALVAALATVKRAESVVAEAEPAEIYEL